MIKSEKLPPDRSLGRQVRACHRGFDRLLNARLSSHKLKTGYWYYLRALWSEDGVTQKRLSDLTNVTETTTVSLINGMIEAGLVTRTRDTVDRRKFAVNLTEEGRALEGELMHHAIEINEVAARGIAKRELETCLSVLARMIRNLDIEIKTIESDQPSG
ncbi:MarR family transcriptional regulator [Sphingomonas turrisvirgatae]|uniref:MarR family transcriptional regulator n=1 Tax=Sphingomonas turrisvirgatae TaxID=1888892 RepID=A0A1E3LWG6_9SPHN|nr:MarR family transcriptional regulator [Sphingomonas turrisvirgatae]